MVKEIQANIGELEQDKIDLDDYYDGLIKSETKRHSDTLELIDISRQAKNERTDIQIEKAYRNLELLGAPAEADDTLVETPEWLQSHPDVTAKMTGEGIEPPKVPGMREFAEEAAQ